jgi:hypothetical protein
VFRVEFTADNIGYFSIAVIEKLLIYNTRYAELDESGPRGWCGIGLGEMGGHAIG